MVKEEKKCFNYVVDREEGDANLVAMQADISSMKDGIAVEVTSAYYDLQAEKKRVDAASGAQDMAKKLLHFAELNYNAHIGTSLQVLDAETAFHKAEMDQVSAQYDLELAKAKLNKAIGAEII